MGFGGSNWLCRVTYSLSANLRILFDRAKHIGASPSIYAPVLLGLLRRRRFYIVFHHYVGKRSFEKLGAFGIVPWMCEQILLRAGTRYVAINQAVARRLTQVNRNADILRNANGFSPDLLALPRQDTLNAATGNAPFILFLGRFDVYMKGLDLLVQAWAHVLGPRGIDLILAGRGDRKDLDRIVASAPRDLAGSVRIESPVSEERKRELLSRCLYFASPSRFEGFGIAALEANAAGVAVLASDAEGFRESLKPGITAFTVAVDDLRALQDGMIRLADDAHLRESMGRAGREHAQAYSWEAIAQTEWEWLRNPK